MERTTVSVYRPMAWKGRQYRYIDRWHGKDDNIGILTDRHGKDDNIGILTDNMEKDDNIGILTDEHGKGRQYRYIDR